MQIFIFFSLKPYPVALQWPLLVLKPFRHELMVENGLRIWEK